MMNIGIPSIFVKMLRQKFDQQWSVRKTEMTEQEQHRTLRLLKPANLHFDARLEGPMLQLRDLLNLEPGDVLKFDYPMEKPVDLFVNGRLKYRGRVVSTGRKIGLAIDELTRLPE
jgi:flagellar motor switch protein FliM